MLTCLVVYLLAVLAEMLVKHSYRSWMELQFVNKWNTTSSIGKSEYLVFRLAVNIFLKKHKQSLVAKITVLNKCMLFSNIYFKVKKYFFHLYGVCSVI